MKAESNEMMGNFIKTIKKQSLSSLYAADASASIEWL